MNLILVSYWRNQRPYFVNASILTTEKARMGNELSEFSQTDSQVTESAVVRSVNSGFRPTQGLQYLQSVVLKGGLFFRYSFAQMRLTFSRKQIKAGEQGSGTHMHAHWRRYNPFQKHRQQIFSFDSKCSRQKYSLSSRLSSVGYERYEILTAVLLNFGVIQSRLGGLTSQETWCF
jgi:hypothetical protein